MPTKDIATASPKPVKWYVFYSDSAGREYYFQPDTQVTTWIRPDEFQSLKAYQDNDYDILRRPESVHFNFKRSSSVPFRPSFVKQSLVVESTENLRRVRKRSGKELGPEMDWENFVGIQNEDQPAKAKDCGQRSCRLFTIVCVACTISSLACLSKRVNPFHIELATNTVMDTLKETVDCFLSNTPGSAEIVPESFFVSNLNILHQSADQQTELLSDDLTGESVTDEAAVNGNSWETLRSSNSIMNTKIPILNTNKLRHVIELKEPRYFGKHPLDRGDAMNYKLRSSRVIEIDVKNPIDEKIYDSGGSMKSFNFHDSKKKSSDQSKGNQVPRQEVTEGKDAYESDTDHFKQTVEKLPKKCFVPLSHIIFAGCRLFLQNSPIFDVETFIHSIMQ